MALLVLVGAAVLIERGAPLTATESTADAVRRLDRPAAVAAFQQQGSLPATGAASSSPAETVVRGYCISCHNSRSKTGGLALDQADFQQPENTAEIWEKVIVKLRSRVMPPPGVRRPSSAAYDEAAEWLERRLDEASARSPYPGRATIHRLNRTEYGNAIRDLLHVDIDVSQLLPPDGSAFGFDNIADALTMTPGLMERYLSAAAKIARIAVADPTIPPGVDTYTDLKNLWQDDRRGEEFPFGSRGGVVARHYFPVDAEYTLRVRLHRTYTNFIRGLANRNEIEIRVDGARVASFTVGGQTAQGRSNAEYRRNADNDLQVRVPIKAGSHQVLATIVKTMSAEAEGMGPARDPIWSFGYADNANTPMGIFSIQIGGPYDARPTPASPSRRRIFICQPATPQEEAGCASRIISTLARRAYRRPVAPETLAPLMEFYRSARSQGSFDTAIQAALEAILASPDFLFRIEESRGGNEPRVTDIDLASRLSFFLWSAPPDDELLSVAEKGQLSAPGMLERQTRRLLASPRAKDALVDNFFGQWLQIRNVHGLTPDTSVKFPDFDDNLRLAMMEETRLFLREQLEQDRPAVELLSANYTYLNERLARHYGIPGIYGSHFRRVTIADEHRRGLLGHASVLSVTSYPNRTSPTVRGKWLLENILAAPMPPPPPQVPPLKEDGDGHKPTSVREALEMHRKNPVCASCHAQMDPLGFGLENFDALGRWRTLDNGVPIDAAGTLLDGTKFEGPAQLRELLVDRQQLFVQALTSKLMTYALGRNMEWYDTPAVRDVVRRSAAEGHRWSALILGIVNSTPFQSRGSRS